jgi:uncharacterized protein YraI
MKLKFRAVASVLLILAALMLGVASAGAQDGGDGLVRFVHVIPGASAVDVYTDGQLTVVNLGYGDGTGYIQMPAGEHGLTVTPTGLQTVLWEQNVTVADVPLTLIASDPDAPSFAGYNDDLESVQLGTTRFTIVHAIAGGPAVDITASGEPVGSALEYGQFLGAFDIPSDSYELAILPSGGDVADAIFGPALVGLNSSTSQMVIAYGTPSDPNMLVLTAPTDAGLDSGFVRITHAVAGGSAVDVVVVGGDAPVVLAASLDFAASTGHLAIPAGTYSVEVRQSGTNSVLLETELTVESGVAQTVVALGSGEDISAAVFTDETGSITADTALVSLINAIPGDSTVSLTLPDGTVVADGLGSGEGSDVASIDPVSADISATFTLGEESATLPIGVETLYGGVYYNVIAVSGTAFSPPTLIFAPTVLAQGVASAPGSGDVELVQAAPTEVAVEPTAAPAETPAPTEAAPEVPATPAPVPTEESAGPTARVQLDPGANLQLRQYPSAEALSLGLAPSGTILLVNGREGAPVDLEGEEIIEEGAEPFVDSATLLDPEDEDADLDPEATWLNVTYETPDGGAITAWINALYIELRDEDGELMKLADLPLVPANQPGEAVDTAITPPPVPENLVTVVVINLDPGANLNLRRTPETTGEVLARVPNGTVAEFLGIGQSGEWAFVRYLPAEGGSVTGWVSARYIEYRLNSERVDVEDLQIRNLYPDADEEVDRGEISAGAPAVVQPTPDPLRDVFVGEVNLNPGANLNLRRTPSDQAEVIQRIPTGSRVIIEGRTADGEWLLTSFEGDSGWVSSDFLILTFNEEAAEVESIPIVETETETEEGTG